MFIRPGVKATVGDHVESRIAIGENRGLAERWAANDSIGGSKQQRAVEQET